MFGFCLLYLHVCYSRLQRLEIFSYPQYATPEIIPNLHVYETECSIRYHELNTLISDIYDAGIHLLSRLHKNTKLLHFGDIQVISVCTVLSTMTRVHDNAHGNGCLSLLELRLNVLLYYDRIMIKNLVLLTHKHSGIKIQEVIYVFLGFFKKCLSHAREMSMVTPVIAFKCQYF